MKKLFIALMVLFFITSCQQKDTADSEDTKGATERVKETIVKGCTKDLKVCPDGNSVVRNPENQCQFNPCPSEAKKGDALARKQTKKEGVMCTADAKECSDGSFVGRDHHNNCKFKTCPPGEKAKEIM